MQYVEHGPKEKCEVRYKVYDQLDNELLVHVCLLLC